jgi:hypothetical protein
MTGIRKFVDSLHNGMQLPESDVIKNTITEIVHSKESMRVASFIRLLASGFHGQEYQAAGDE